MNPQTNIFLIGLMGAGKTTIGKQLAKALYLEFIDSDHEIEHRTGASISLIFDVEGEEGFRNREKEVIDELSQRRGIVLATGGGAILDLQNRQHLMNRGCVIYLQASVDQLLQRTAHDRNRPLLQTADPRTKLETLMAEREPLYLETATITVNTGGASIRSALHKVLAHLKSTS